MRQEYELVGVAEAADIVGAKKSTFVVRVATRNDFPKPLTRLKCGPIWSKNEVVAWATSHVGEDRESKMVVDLGI